MIFLEGAQFTACPLHPAVKKISLLQNIGTAYGPVVFYWLYAVSLLFFDRLFRRSLVSAADGVHCTDVKGKKFSG
ncbi:hypothetical protein [Bacteroides thetaiotaomicron]|uniref:hypothetical protein n=1 Tax=Bacteroides thetaiotaomicron TaxID=818 RepID=UPI0003AACD19|nr:hypothetical protein [Bacteroides thetaiotaomicron]